MSDTNCDFVFKILMIGDSSVGKTCIIVRFCEDAFNSTYVSTIGVDYKIKTIDLKGKKIKLQIWDTAGQERFRSIATSYYREAKGIMLIYDITRRVTFENISKWLTTTEELAPEDAEKMILGNKSDETDQRHVTASEAEEFAKSHNIRFMEISAKDNTSIDEAFIELANNILSKIPESKRITYPDPTSLHNRATTSCCRYS